MRIMSALLTPRGLIRPLTEFANPGSWSDMEEYDESDFCGDWSAEYIEVICQGSNMDLILAQERRWLEREDWELSAYMPEM